LLASIGGFGGLASLLVLAAIVAGAVRLIEAVGLAAEGAGQTFAVATAAAGLVCLVAAGATHVVWLAAGLFACTAIELLGRHEAVVELPAEPAAELRRAA
jgi:hypothetical protein